MKLLLRSVRQWGLSKSHGVLVLIFASILMAGAAVPFASRFAAQNVAAPTKTDAPSPLSAPVVAKTADTQARTVAPITAAPAALSSAPFTFENTGSLNGVREWHTATLLQSGKVLV